MDEKPEQLNPSTENSSFKAGDSPHKKQMEPPEDKGNVVARVFLLWGIGVLLPWNAVLTMFDFFGAEMKDDVHNYNPSFVYPFGVNGLNSIT